MHADPVMLPLQAKGALAAAQPAGPLPPFERWSMAGPRYVQFLTDLLRVHTALESAIAAAQSAASLKGYGVLALHICRP